MEQQAENTIDWLRVALPEPVQPDPRHAHPFFQQQLIEAFRHAAASPSFAAPRLTRWFRENRKLGSKERRRVSDAVYGLIKHEQLLRRANRWGEEHWAQAWIDLCAGYRFPELPSTSPAEDFATALSIPKHITEEWRRKKTPEQCQTFAQSINRRAPTFLRAQGITPRALQERLAHENIETRLEPSGPYALSLVKRANLQASPSFRKGLFEVQDLSSQRLCAAIPKDGVIVDMCAGAGGKSLALAAEGATVYASDIRSHALTNLKKRAQRAGLSIKIGIPKRADIVLLDAPCSGSGRLRREPTLRWKWRRCPPSEHKIQQQLLHKAAGILRGRGTIVYATCSLLDSENTPVLPGWTTREERWIWPERGDGFYWNILQKK